MKRRICRGFRDEGMKLEGNNCVFIDRLGIKKDFHIDRWMLPFTEKIKTVGTGT